MYADYQPYNSTLVNLTTFELMTADGNSTPSDVDALQYVTTYDVYQLLEAAVVSHAEEHGCFVHHCNLSRVELNQQLQARLVRYGAK